jgi:hypothetical protein
MTSGKVSIQTDKMDVALRVLNAITRNRPPAPDDIVVLKLWVGPDDQLLPAGDLAQFVMNRELRVRLKDL